MLIPFMRLGHAVKVMVQLPEAVRSPHFLVIIDEVQDQLQFKDQLDYSRRKGLPHDNEIQTDEKSWLLWPDHQLDDLPGL